MVKRISTEKERAGGGFMAFDCGLAKAGSCLCLSFQRSTRGSLLCVCCASRGFFSRLDDLQAPVTRSSDRSTTVEMFWANYTWEPQFRTHTLDSSPWLWFVLRFLELEMGDMETQTISMGAYSSYWPMSHGYSGFEPAQDRHDRHS